MSTNTFPPSPTKSFTRTTIPVDNEVYEVFKRLAKAGNMSAGKAMGEWLADTVEAAELMASTMERARAAPKLVTAELHAMALGMADQTKDLMDKFAKIKASHQGVGLPASAGGLRPGGMLASLNPPPCNTGGKGTQNRKGKPS